MLSLNSSSVSFLSGHRGLKEETEKKKVFLNIFLSQHPPHFFCSFIFLRFHMLATTGEKKGVGKERTTLVMLCRCFAVRNTRLVRPSFLRVPFESSSPLKYNPFFQLSSMSHKHNATFVPTLCCFLFLFLMVDIILVVQTKVTYGNPFSSLATVLSIGTLS